MSGSVAQPLVQASLVGEAIDHGPVAVFVADEDMRYIAVNEFACSLLGYSRAELLELRVTDVARGPEAAQDFADVVTKREGAGTVRLTTKTGRELSVSYLAQATRVAGMAFFVAVTFGSGVAKNGSAG
ncbi:MAG: PAS domain-containing protein [Thermoleophilia bacterium]|nr:PAS domain-containing protein [Thermoleophilia bacterium]